MVSNASKASMYAKDLPWNTYKPEELGPTIMQFVTDHEPFFRRWAEIWYENFQFLFGNHSIKWSKKYGFAVDYDFLRTNSVWTLKANTNLVRTIVESLSSFIFGNIPEWDADTMDESSIKGKRFKKIIQKLLEAYMERLLMQKELSVAAGIFAMFGQVGYEIDWNPMCGSLMEIPRQKKVKVPIWSTYMAPNQMTGGLIEVPTQIYTSQGTPYDEERWEPELDAMGRQIIDKMFAGDIDFNVLTPFEYRRELGKYGMHKSKWIQRFKLMDYDDYLDYYGQLPGQTKEYGNIRPVYADPTVYDMAIKHFMRMQFTTPPSVDDGFGRSQNVFKSQLFRYKVWVVEHWDRPHPKKWPLGRRVVVANGVCTHITTPNYSTNKRDGWHPFIESQWLTAAPNSIAAGPTNDVIRKNKEMNVKDTLIATAVRRNMGSQLLLKINSGIDPQQLTGEPGMAHEVNDIMGARWLHDDMPIPPVLAQMRQQDKDDIYESSGGGDAIRGEASRGSSSGYQEKQREEREEKRLGMARREFQSGVSGAGAKIVACLKANVVKLDKSVMGFLKRSAAGEFSTADVLAFLTTPLDYGIDVKVVESSMAVKSKASQQALLQELSGGALAQRLGQDAKVLDEYLKFFDATTLRDGSAAHRDRANRENEVFLDMLRLGPNTDGLPKPVVLFEDDDDIHGIEHVETFVKNFEEFRNNEAFLIEFITHMERHRIQKDEKAGKYAPGTSTQTAAMMAQARQTALPTPQTIFVDSQQRQQAQQQTAQQQPPGGPPAAPQAPAPQPGQQGAPAPKPGKPPQAPRQPSGPGGGPGKINPQAPSQNTPSASRGGMM